MQTLCRDCTCAFDTQSELVACIDCDSTRLISHAELHQLSIAHIDCDAFYASVEKRDNPTIRGKPVIIGGGRRGVVSACCYVARISGVRSAMPMFEANKRCPNAVVIPPNMDKYRDVGLKIRSMMREMTPLVEPISIDEAFLDLTGTEKLHGGSAAKTLINLVQRIEEEVGVTASVGLSYNKFLAKVASDLDKPRGFSIVGEAEALDFLAVQPVKLLWGVGKALQKKLHSDGIESIGDLRRYDESDLMKRYGAIGRRLHLFSHGRDERRVETGTGAKSISAETTFSENIRDADELRRILWQLSEKVSKRLKAAALAGGGVTLKLKQADFRQLTRSRILSAPTQMAEELYRESLPLLDGEADGRSFRLIGVGATRLCNAENADAPDLLDPAKEDRLKIEKAMDAVRHRFGGDSILKGRGFRQ
jgi:DNA polymerase-4